MSASAESPPAPSARAAPDPSSAQVDLSKPILRQVGALGAAEYDAWVHAPISARHGEKNPVPGKHSGSLRIFVHDFWERHSHIPWWLVLVVWIPIVTGLFLWGALGWSLPFGTQVLWGAIGFVAWTLTEYVLHRFVFHYKPRSAFGRKLHFLAHGVHHLDPWDPTRLVFPPLAGLIIASGLFGLWVLVIGLPLATPAMGGLLIGYLLYDMTHYYTHHGKPRGRWGKYLKRYHLEHHHRYWELLFGVSQPFWDIVFRTGRPKSSA